MAHESFESETTAALMNELFVNVKVDREERPDVDAVTMEAAVGMTARAVANDGLHDGGREAFYAGRTSRGASARDTELPELLRAVSESWRERRDDIERQALRIDRSCARP